MPDNTPASPAGANPAQVPDLATQLEQLKQEQDRLAQENARLKQSEGRLRNEVGVLREDRRRFEAMMDGSSETPPPQQGQVTTTGGYVPYYTQPQPQGSFVPRTEWDQWRFEQQYNGKPDFIQKVRQIAMDQNRISEFFYPMLDEYGRPVMDQYGRARGDVYRTYQNIANHLTMEELRAKSAVNQPTNPATPPPPNFSPQAGASGGSSSFAPENIDLTGIQEGDPKALKIVEDEMIRTGQLQGSAAGGGKYRPI